MNHFWIPFSTYSERADLQITQALDACHTVHLWTMETCKEQFIQTLRVPTLRELKYLLTPYVQTYKLRRYAQRYTLTKASEKAAAQFRQEVIVKSNGKIHFPKRIEREEYQELTVQSRQIWQRYLEDYEAISTTFGMLTLEGDWQDILFEQAQAMGVKMEYLPHLWHSVTIKNDKTLHFNFYRTTSLKGKRQKSIKIQKTNH